MNRVNIILLLLITSIYSFNVAAGERGRGHQSKERDLLEIKKACDIDFKYDYQRKECAEVASSGEAVRYCVEAYSYDYERFDCLKATTNDGSDNDHSVGHHDDDSALDIIKVCSIFNYEYQRQDCAKAVLGDTSVVRVCYDSFSYDYQRFDCLKSAKSGKVVRFCVKNFNYDYERFDCFKKY